MAQQSKQDLINSKRLQREVNEKATCGGYQVIYPFITYAEEDLIKDKVVLLKASGHAGRSVKAQIGLDAPKTLKEKLATAALTTKGEGGKEGVNNRSSQKSLGLQE